MPRDGGKYNLHIFFTAFPRENGLNKRLLSYIIKK